MLYYLCNRTRHVKQRVEFAKERVLHIKVKSLFTTAVLQIQDFENTDIYAKIRQMLVFTLIYLFREIFADRM